MAIESSRRSFIKASALVVASGTLDRNFARGVMLPTPLNSSANLWGIWVGGATQSSVAILVSASEPATYQAKAYSSVDPARLESASQSVQTTPPQSFRHSAGGDHRVGHAALLTLSGLTPNTKYEIRLVDADGNIDNRVARVATLPTIQQVPPRWRIAFGSCSRALNVNMVFRRILDHSPDMFLHLGDLHYHDITSDDESLFLSNFLSIVGEQTQSVLLSQVNTEYIWDDHDFGLNNGHAMNVSARAARAAYDKYVPHGPLGDTSGNEQRAKYRSRQFGRIRLIISDNMSERSAPLARDAASKVVWSPTQLDWFRSECIDAKRLGQMIVWASSNPTNVSGATANSWNKYKTARKALWNWFASERLHSRMVILTGDAHHNLADSGATNDFSDGRRCPIPIFGASPFQGTTNSLGGSFDIYDDHAPVGRTAQHYGLLDIEDRGATSLNCRYLAYSSNNNVKKNYAFRRNI